MAYLLTPTLEVRTSREFIASSPTNPFGFRALLCDFEYDMYKASRGWGPDNSNFISNKIGATSNSSGTIGGSSEQGFYELPVGIYKMHIHIELKCNSAYSGSGFRFLDDLDGVTQTSTSSSYYFSSDNSIPIDTSVHTVTKSTKQKNIQFCSSRSDTSAIESSRAYMTFDHHLEWSHVGGRIEDISSTLFSTGRGFVSMEDFWYILRRVR